MATPRQEDSLAEALGRTHLMYGRHINRMHGRCGHLWQDRFFSSSLDEEYSRTAAIYVERNPVRAGVVGRAWEYPWSSAFLSKLERRLGRRLRPLPIGRPKKDPADANGGAKQL